ncbi:putative leucine-rich repeat-containing protein DDB_G0281931 isoform X2 [Stylophora pistillata]|uniref:putative leucine-rich repeat-containing protein DDB_G0281931 isoform X2 n=1 Tax=Stylophora pistillata TaxID=50429 RepID=UPI000C049DF1|nr:putative leucine-rich repeat-containing protein DDB_G0281931 isoform X2 [Stylophora pistillata]
MEGLTDQLKTFYLDYNKLTSVPDLTGPDSMITLRLQSNKIRDLSRIATSGIGRVFELRLGNNKIDLLPINIFQNTSVVEGLDLSSNSLQSLPDNVFKRLDQLNTLVLTFNNITHINKHTFSGLSSLTTLFLIKNNITFIAKDAFDGTPRLKSLFLHSNAIKTIESTTFDRLVLKQLTIFDNPLSSLPDGIFDEMTNHTKVSLTCTNLRQLPRGKYVSQIECAPSTSLHVILDNFQSRYEFDFMRSGFVCHDCASPEQHHMEIRCRDCSLCPIGTYTYPDENCCLQCPAGGFYQDEMGQVDCKRCSIGTFVAEQKSPGTKATDCVSCPYGTLSNETANYRACRCLHKFYRLDRFGPCSACPPYGFVCENDTAILAPNYFWKWSNQSEKELFKGFVDNIYSFGPQYNKSYSTFNTLTPKPLICPYARSCKGGIDSGCLQGYQGTLCATCSNGFYFRFNSCLKCPRLFVTVISSIAVICVFVIVFLLVLWGDTKRTDNNRTVADVIMSCVKIVLGFYQTIVGIFSALAQVHWPFTLISMEKFLKVMEGNILQFAPLSCIHSSLRLDQFGKFLLIIVSNVSLVVLFFSYSFLKKCYIMKKKDLDESEKANKVKSLKKSCCRNIFLLLLMTYPITSKSIIQVLPLPGACVETCFSDDKSDCIFLLRTDYSIQCYTPRHRLYILMASIAAFYPVGFPILVLVLTLIYRNSEKYETISFGLKVFFENYKEKFWYWEVIEMYRKLILIALIHLFGSNSLFQISLTVLTVSVSGVVYTLFRPIKDKFEDRLQTFVLWIIFFDVCLGAVYTNCDESQGEGKNDSIFANVLFVVLNASVLLLAIGNGILHLKSISKYITFNPIRCFSFLCQGLSRLKNRVVSRRGTYDEL